VFRWQPRRFRKPVAAPFAAAVDGCRAAKQPIGQRLASWTPPFAVILSGAKEPRAKRIGMQIAIQNADLWSTPGQSAEMRQSRRKFQPCLWKLSARHVPASRTISSMIGSDDRRACLVADLMAVRWQVRDTYHQWNSTLPACQLASSFLFPDIRDTCVRYRRPFLEIQ
jgi:hypothetical protein